MAAIRQVPLVCGGHERPVVDLKFSGITETGSYMISASKGTSRFMFLFRNLHEIYDLIWRSRPNIFYIHSKLGISCRILVLNTKIKYKISDIIS